MRNFRLLICFLLVLWQSSAFSQDFSNKGTDFWLGYGYHVNMAGNPAGGGTQDMVLYFTSDKNAKVTVEIPGLTLPYSFTYTVLANQVTTSNPIPKTGTQDARISGIGTYNSGIHITSDVPVVAYAHIYNASVSGASLLFPTATLGKDYYSVNYTQSSNAASANSFVFVVATEDATSVEITPSAANLNGLAVALPAVVKLNKGQIYSVMGTTNGNVGTDLTGTRIRSISNNSTGGCKKIAVFSGSGKISIGGTAGGSADNLFAQAFPAVAWGKKYLTAPTGSQPNNYYRVCVTDPKTVVKLNGVVLPASSLIGGFYYQFKNGNAIGTNGPVPNLIESDIPIMVAQYITTQGQDGNPNTTPFGDPEMIYLSPVEQTINNITLYSASKYLILQSYINVIVKNGGVASFKIDGVSKPSFFANHPQEPNYSYAIIPVSSGSHTVYSDSGFNAIAYGFGSAESYGYNAGTNIRDFTPTASFQNKYKRLDSAISCVNSPFQFGIPLNFLPSSLRWEFTTAPNINPMTTIGPIDAPVPDSTIQLNGQSIYYFSTHNTFTFSRANTAALRDTIKLFTTSTTPDGCGSTDQVFTVPVKVLDLPIANFTTNNSGCVSDSVHFIDATNTSGEGKIETGLWDFGDGTIDSIFNPVKKYTIANSYNIRYRPISNYGCIGDTIITLSFSAPPIAQFKYSDSCVSKNILFTDQSTIAAGNIVKWYWDYGDGTKDTLTNNTPKNKIYTSEGSYNVSLILESNTGCLSTATIKTITIRPLPVTNFQLPTAVCLPIGAAPFIDATTISAGIVTKWQWDFGDGGIDSIQNPTHNYAATGTYNIKLTAVSNYGCTKDSVQTLNNIYPQPKAAFNISNYVCLRDSTSYSDASDGLGSAIVKWNWRFGDGYTDTVPSAKHLYLNPSVDTVKLFVVSDKGCMSDTAVHTTIINQLPLAGFSTTAINNYCENKSITFIDTATDRSISTAVLNRWYWDMGNGNTKTLTNGGKNTSFNEFYNNFNTYNVKMLVENSLGCKSDTVTNAIAIHAQPHVGFILPEVCLDDALAVFTDTTTIADGSTAVTWNWNYNAAIPAVTPAPILTSATSQNGSAKYKLAANYQVSYKVTTSFGCDSTLTQAFTVNGSTPHANFVVLNDTKLCSNDSIRIYDSSYVDFGVVTKNDIYWNYVGAPTVDSVDDNTLFKKQYPHLYSNFQTPATKTYQIRMTAHSGNSSVCASSITKTITIHQSPKVLFTTVPGICNDTTARQITQAKELGGVPGAFVYTGSGISATGLFTPNSQTPGTYPIKYFYSTSFGCADSATKPITVWPSPVAKWGVNAILCEKNNIQFTDSSVANYSNIVQRYWDFGDGTNIIYSSNAPFTKQYAVGNTYAASLRVVTDSGCRSTYNIQNLKLNFLPVVNFTLPSICLPDGRGLFKNFSSIKDNSEGLFTYLWNFGDPNNPSASTLKQPTHQYTALGPVSVQLKITSKDLCIDSLTQTLSTIYPQPKADFATNPSEICLNDQINFIDNSNGKTSAMNTWYWDLANGTSSGVQNPNKKFTDSGSFKISLYAYNQQGCVSDTMVKTVTVHPYPKLVLGPNLKVLEFGMIPIKPKYVYGTALSYLWTPATDLSSDTAKVPICKPKTDITYQLTLTGIGNCSVSDTIFVKVLLAPVVPNVFSPNGDGINDTWRIQYLESYPGATIDVFNRYGQKVFSSLGYEKEWDGTYKGNPLPIGTYYYIINPKNGRALISGSVTIIK